MSDRTFVALLVSGCGVVLIGLIWIVATFTGSPREAHADPGAATASEIARLSDQIDNLSQRLNGMPGRPAAGVGAPAGAHGPTEVAEGEILVLWTNHDLPVNDPFAAAWDAAPATKVALQAQDQTMPVLDTVTIPEVSVKALTDGRQIAWRLTWDDPTADYHLDTDLFCDAVAIQFPLIANANYQMGEKSMPVQIMQWKAIWQKDIDEHFQDVQDLHPNYWADLYWFADGEFPYPVPDAFSRTESRDWFIAYKAGNPMADLYRKTPVQEMIAEGYGTLTNQPKTATVASGVWRVGTWSVVFSRPLATNDRSDYQFKPGARDVVAFAVWEGSVENVSGRKHHSQWVVFEVQQ